MIENHTPRMPVGTVADIGVYTSLTNHIMWIVQQICVHIADLGVPQGSSTVDVDVEGVT